MENNGITKKRARAVAGLLTCTMLTAAVSSYARDDAARYTMAAVIDAAFGHKVTAGRYDQAIEKITSKSRHFRQSFEASTNLCVAYTKVGDLDSAAVACDQAVAKMRERTKGKGPEPVFRGANSIVDREFLAVALTNRGVLHAVSGEFDAAYRYFAEAQNLDAKIDTPRANLARIASDLAPGVGPDS